MKIFLLFIKRLNSFFYLIRKILALLTFLSFGINPANAQDKFESTEWLNVKELGATGSAFETKATITAGSNRIIVDDTGDFQVGQQVILAKSNIRYTEAWLHGPGEPYSTSRPLNNALEMRGYNGEAGSWITYIVEVDQVNPLSFRWKEDLSKDWYEVKVPVTYDWQKLGRSTEIKFNHNLDWVCGHMITFSARDQLEATIINIENNVFTLDKFSNNTASDALISHTDREILQKIIDIALKENKNLFFSSGRYRIPGGLEVVDPQAIQIEGANAETTILDISDGDGSCFHIQRGKEVTIRNFSMIGHTGLNEAPLSFNTVTGYGFWPNSLKGCNAIHTTGTERVLVENVHVTKMANEAFYAQGPAREGKKEPVQYQKSLTYYRCSVTDCAANAFNNNDRAENTSILYCRVDGAGWHAAEMPARFLRVIGSYFRNTGAVTVGDMSHRYEDLNELGCGQAFICDNVFEGTNKCQGISVNVGSQDIEGIGLCSGIAVSHGSSQVIISGNVFVNFNGNAIMVSSQTVRPAIPWFSPDATQHWGSYPSRSVIISGNIIDMTSTGQNSVKRTGIKISSSDVTVSNNQIYTRGKIDSMVTGISLSDPALKISVHDNFVYNCGEGLITKRCSSRVMEVLDSCNFRESSLPLEWRYTHQYQGWIINWIKDGKVKGSSEIDFYDPESLIFKLKNPFYLKPDDVFEVYFPGPINWNIHNNTISGCNNPVILDNYGSMTSLFCNNVIDRNGADGVKAAVIVEGLYKISDNTITGFNEKNSCGFLIMNDRLNKPMPNLYLNNIISHCMNGIKEGAPRSLRLSEFKNNDFTECKKTVKKADQKLSSANQ